jgi:hypothetical protein
MSNDDVTVIFTHPGKDGNKIPLAIDSRNRLLWDDKLLITEQKVTVDRWVSAAVMIGAFATLVLASVAVLDFLCR